MQKEIEIIKDGLSYNEELECIAKTFWYDAGANA